MNFMHGALLAKSRDLEKSKHATLPTIGSHGRASDLCQPLASLYVFQNGLLYARVVLVAFLQH
jgi:hypothetical protein